MAEPKQNEKDPELDLFFAAARTEADAPLPGALHARILSDAHDTAASRESTPRVPLWRRIWNDLGGLPLLTGLATATLAGLWIGGTSPAMLDTFWDNVAGETLALDTYFLDVDSVLEGI